MANYADKRKKKLKTSKSKSGAQLFMSDEAKEQMRNRPFKGSEIENLIDQHLHSRMLEGEITPKKSGRTQAETYIDMSARSFGNDKSKVAKKKYGGKVAKMEAGGEASKVKKKNSSVGATMRPLTNSEEKELFYRNKKLQEKAREKAKMSALHRRDKEFLKDFENESDSDVRGHLLGKHAEDGLNLMRYGADAQAGRSFGQKTRAEPYKKYRNGGMVEGYEHGGEVSGSCRGGGAAVRGTKFSGVK